jgi:CHAT domain-containing protein
MSRGLANAKKQLLENPDLLKKYPFLEIERIVLEFTYQFEYGLMGNTHLYNLVQEGHRIAKNNQYLSGTKDYDIALAHLYEWVARYYISCQRDNELKKFYLYKALLLKMKHLVPCDSDIMFTKWLMVSYLYEESSEFAHQEKAWVEEMMNCYRQNPNMEKTWYSLVCNRKATSFQYSTDFIKITNTKDIKEKKVIENRVKKNLDSCIYYLEIGAKSAEKELGIYSQSNAYLLGSLASIYHFKSILENNPEFEKKSKQLENKVLEIRLKFTTPQALKAYQLWASFTSEGNLEKQNQLLHELFSLFSTDIQQNNLLSYPKIDSKNDSLFALISAVDVRIATRIGVLGSYIREKNHISSDTLKSLIGWLDTYYDVLLLNYAQQQFNDENLKTTGTYNLEVAPRNGIWAAYQLFKQTSDDYWKEKILEYWQLGMRYTLDKMLYQKQNLELISKNYPKILELENEKKSWKLKALQLEKQNIISNASKIAEYYSKALDYRLLQDSLSKKFYKEKKDKINEIIFNLSDLQKLIKEQNSSFMYLYPYKFPNMSGNLPNNKCLVMYLDQDTVLLHEAVFEHSIDSLVDYFRKGCDLAYDIQGTVRSNALSFRTKEQDAHYLHYAHLFYEKLFKPFEERLKNKTLFLIPNGNLSYLPFDLLLTQEVKLEKDEWIDFENLPYFFINQLIIQHYDIRLLMNTLKNQNEEKINVSFVGFAPVAGSSSKDEIQGWALRGLLSDLTKLPDIHKQLRCNDTPILPATAWEVFQAQKYFNNPVQFYNQEATENSLISTLNSNILHIATHATGGSSDNENAFLVFFSDSTQVVNEDGKLFFYELRNLTSKAQLAVLSACHTGYGAYQFGEGIQSLGYGFSLSGVPNLIMSQWAASDVPSAIIMVDFYKHLSKGMTKAEALRQAKLDFLRNPEYSHEYKHPFYWGAYFLLGDNKGIGLEKPIYFQYWFWVVSLIFTIIAFLIWKRKSIYS